MRPSFPRGVLLCLLAVLLLLAVGCADDSTEGADAAPAAEEASTTKASTGESAGETDASTPTTEPEDDLEDEGLEEESAGSEGDYGAEADETVWLLHANAFSRRLSMASLRLMGYTTVEETAQKLVNGDPKTRRGFERALRFYRHCAANLGDRPYRSIESLDGVRYLLYVDFYRQARQGCRHYRRGAVSLSRAFDLRSNALLRAGERQMKKGDRAMRDAMTAMEAAETAAAQN